MKDTAQDSLVEVHKRWPLGVYRHYKQNDYILFSVTVNEATMEPMMHYYSVSKESRWTRTISDFGSRVEHGGVDVPRFRYVGPCGYLDLVNAAGIHAAAG